MLRLGTHKNKQNVYPGNIIYNSAIFNPPKSAKPKSVKTQHLRKDPTCLNCGTEVTDRFCSHCGQENIETKEPFGHLVSHFFQDITHYDSKFLQTFKYLFTKPGLLTRQYVDGRRMDYVNPIRLYIFTSFVFFLVLSIFNHPEEKKNNMDEVNTKLEKKMEKFGKKREELQAAIAKGDKDSVKLKEELKNVNTAELLFTGPGTTVEQAIGRYDSLQQALPADERDGFVMRAIMHRSLKVQYGGQEAQRTIGETLKHNLPKLMFILLPFFALLLKMVYFRRKMYYTEHAIFTIHIHTLIFMLSLLAFLIYQFWHYDGLYAWMMLIVYIYFIIALKRFYGGSTGKALLKSILILACYGAGAIIILLAYVIIIAAIAL